jgi:hypothetical protein
MTAALVFARLAALQHPWQANWDLFKKGVRQAVFDQASAPPQRPPPSLQAPSTSASTSKHHPLHDTPCAQAGGPPSHRERANGPRRSLRRYSTRTPLAFAASASRTPTAPRRPQSTRCCCARWAGGSGFWWRSAPSFRAEVSCATSLSRRCHIIATDCHAADASPALPGGELRAVLDGCVPGSATNEGAGIEPGDVVVSVCGAAATPGPGSLDRCLTALAGSGTVDGEAFAVVVSRADLRACGACARFASCAACRAKGRLAWHAAHECVATLALPAAAAKGETSPLRTPARPYMVAPRQFC